MDKEAWRAAIYGIAKNRTWLSDWTELNWIYKLISTYSIGDIDVHKEILSSSVFKENLGLALSAKQLYVHSCLEALF